MSRNRKCHFCVLAPILGAASLLCACALPVPPATTPSKPAEPTRPADAAPIVAPPEGDKEMAMEIGKPILFGDIQITLQSLEFRAAEPDSPVLKMHYVNTSKTLKHAPPHLDLGRAEDEHGNFYDLQRHDWRFHPGGLFPGDSDTIYIAYQRFVKPAKKIHIFGRISTEGKGWPVRIRLSLPPR